MGEIDITNPELDWSDYSQEQLVYAELTSPKPLGHRLSADDLSRKKDAEASLLENLTEQNRDRRSQVQSERARKLMAEVADTVSSLGGIRANLKILQGQEGVARGVKPPAVPKVEIDKILKSLSLNPSKWFNDGVKYSIKDGARGFPGDLSGSEIEQVIADAEVIADSPAMQTIVQQLGEVAEALVSQKESDERQQKVTNKFAWGTIVIAGISLLIALATTLKPSPALEFPKEPLPVTVVDRSNSETSEETK